MKVGQKTFVALSYELTVDGAQVETVTAETPMQFVYGIGYMLPQFEANIAGLGKGDTFAFTLTPENGYGEVYEEALIELPKEAFMVEGKVEDDLLVVGNQIPMSNAEGARLLGVVKSVGENTVTMDFNHPMAGKTLDFKGAIVEVREVTPEDMMPFMGGGEGCGCGCSDEGCGEECECSEDKGSCGCGC